MKINLYKNYNWKIFGLLYLIPLVFAESDPANDAEVIEPQAKTTNDEKWVSQLTMEQCDKRKRGCCEQMYLGDEETLMKCYTLHQSKMPGEDEKDPAKLAKFLSCFVECIYKQKKFIAKGDDINMKMVKADAEKMFPDRPKEKDYHIKMMDFCRKDALKMYNFIRLNPAGAVMLRDACRPYLLFVFLCQTDYPKKQSCPYFVWEGKTNTNLEEECKEGKDKCYELDGIVLP